jgi:hypothetical protein
MPIRYAVDHALQRVTVTAEGDLRLEDMVAVLTELATQRCYGYAQCFDARRAVVLLTAEDIRRIVTLTARLRAEHGQARTAFIAESDVSFGMARMYATLAAETDSGCMVYRTLSEGEAWLGWSHVDSVQPAT